MHEIKDSWNSVCLFFQYYRPRITKVHFKETQFELRVLGKDVSFYLSLKEKKKSNLRSNEVGNSVGPSKSNLFYWNLLQETIKVKLILLIVTARKPPYPQV